MYSIGIPRLFRGVRLARQVRCIRVQYNAQETCIWTGSNLEFDHHPPLQRCQLLPIP
jgi:hypothetical protein